MPQPIYTIRINELQRQILLKATETGLTGHDLVKLAEIFPDYDVVSLQFEQIDLFGQLHDIPEAETGEANIIHDLAD